MDYIFRILPNMFSGLGVSAQIFIFTIVLSLPLGMLLAIVRISKVSLFRQVAGAYIYLMRGTPLMLQIMFIYYGLPLHIILPQVVKRVIPPLGNETITLLKDTSLVYILAMNDLMRVTRAFVQRDFDTTPFLVAGVFYLVCTAVLTKILTYVENRYAVYEE